MACPSGTGRYTQFMEAMENLQLWDAFFCMYAYPLGDLVVGTVIYGAFMLGITVKTNNIIIPFILFIVFGGTVLGRMLSVVSPMVGLLVLVVAPLILTGVIFTIDRLG